MNGDIFEPLFEVQDNRLNKLGDPLSELNSVIDWEAFRPLLKKVHQKPRKSTAGAPTKDVVMMFKGLIIQSLYGISDGQLEYQIQDRRSFQRFLGLSSHQRAPDEKTFWAFRNKLTELKLTEKLFKQFGHQLKGAGYIARKGQIVDASLINAPVQRNSREENAQIKQGGKPNNWSTNKARQKDTQARWTRKNNKNYFGYKNHIAIDNQNKLIRDYDVTDASVHDSQVFESLLDPENSSKDVWADSAYRSKASERKLKPNGYRSRVQRKGSRNKPLSKREQQGNRTRSKVRSRVEHIFGTQSQWRSKSIRCIGTARAKTEIGLMNLVYNFRRLCFFERAVLS